MRVLQKLQSLFRFSCVLCRGTSKTGWDVCETCLKRLPWIQHACLGCGIELVDKHDVRCGACLTHPFSFERAHVLWRYEPPVSSMILNFKSHAKLFHARLFSDLFFCQKVSFQKELDCFVPIPLHAKRMRERGFNPVLEWARHLSHLSQIPMKLALQRIHYEKPQRGLSRKERIRNVRHAFQCYVDVCGLHIGLLDDVMTTGSTAEFATSALLKAGAASVTVCALAKTQVVIR